MDAIELLKHDHRMVEQLFRDYDAAASEQQRRGVVDILIRELSKHAALEELMFYPLAKKVLPNGDQEVSEELSQHMTVKKQLAELDDLEVGDAREAELVGHLVASVGEHVQDEEGEFMPKVREHLDEQALEELGQQLDKAKAVAPTRPHPAAPDEPPGLTLVGPVAAIYDRLRDRLQGRPLT